MDRRTFNKKSLKVAAIVGLAPSLSGFKVAKPYVRLGAPVFEKYENPGEWVTALKRRGYRAAYCPVKLNASTAEIKAYEEAAKKADIVIAELWVGSNPISPDKGIAREAFKKCVDSLALTEAIGANCCVNLSGSKNLPEVKGPNLLYIGTHASSFS
jgi:hypothetical protein